MKYSIVISEAAQRQLKGHLVRDDGQEDLCFAFYKLSSGLQRCSALITEIVLPLKGDRNVHGNVSFNAAFFDRVGSLALKKGCGVCFMHSHPSSGWQFMSNDDIKAEEMLAPRVKSITGMPLVGMTIGTDEAWSGRFWIKEAPRQYVRHFCESVRVIGRGLKLTFYDKLLPLPIFDEAFLRTVSAWGDQKQADISRLKIGIIGCGSVGSIIAEALLKTGIQNIMLLDFDTVEAKNLDRLQGIGPDSVGKSKVFEIQNRLDRIKVGKDVQITAVPYSLIEEKGFKSALDCDVLFSCVDRPWPRFLLNFIAYAHMIPVIDGGIDTNPNKRITNLDQARWKVHTVGPERSCLCCLGQFTPEDVALEQSGLLEDPTYIKSLPKDHFVNRGENVFVFSLGLAGMEMQQLLSLCLQPRGQYYGPKEFNFNSGTIDSDFDFHCKKNCEYQKMAGLGDSATVGLTGRHSVAEKHRHKYMMVERGVAKLSLFNRVKNLFRQINYYAKRLQK
ncbi:ThiF family adenylyltransferase [Mucilaginibacter sp.]|uniref:ThiF family adenylyltransferase n=1 Tax=Mucilaginibacter sp. TaxID=1882438 RepID=UPI0025FCE163|nr:ThiF family adenylyltransferase [Mucilaginibacter sp.]